MQAFLLQEFSSPKSGSSGTRIAATESTFVNWTACHRAVNIIAT
jgi:hypothetical protein